ncbi:MAG: hypothetical protein PUH53_06080 [Mycoplasma sp.]|nr:hypothetical protein [Mycoplasma sp.]
MKQNKNILGILYFIIHFIIEITSFYIVSSYIDTNLVWILALMYDFFAFVPQGIFGYLKDKGIKTNFTIIGMILSTLSLILLYFNLNAILVILVLSIGNCMIHIQGAETTLRTSNGQMAPSAIFVSGGSFGVITGKILAMYNVPIPFVIIINLLMLIPIAICNKYVYLIDDKNLEKYNFSNKNINSKVIITLAVFVVIVRAYMGYGIPTTWNKTLIQTILLYCSMGIGKAMGGILIDSIGIKKTALLSTIGSLPFLLFGNNVMAISLIGIMMFSMTMAVTLGLIVSEIKKYPGVAFGFTTVGLFLGSLPVFVFKINSILINCLMVTILTVASVIVLSVICRKEKV